MTRYWQTAGGGVITRQRLLTNDVEVRVVPLDAIVIERSQLPEVTREDGGIFPQILAGEWGWDEGDLTVEHLLAGALAHLAAAEYLTAHPSVDRAKVSALANEIEVAIHASGVGADEIHPLELAERLIATGKVTVTTDGGAS